MTTLRKKGASHFLIFTLFNAKQIKYSIGLASNFKGSSDKDYEIHGLNQSYKL